MLTPARPERARAGAAALAVVLLAGACGAGDAASTATPAPPTDSSAAPTRLIDESAATEPLPGIGPDRVAVTVVLTTSSEPGSGPSGYPRDVQGSPTEQFAQYARTTNAAGGHGARTVGYTPVLFDVARRDPNGGLTGEAARVCREVVQAGAGLVISEAADTTLLSCLTRERRLVLQGIVGLVDQPALKDVEPWRWAPASAGAFDIGNAQVETARQAGLLTRDSAIAVLIDGRAGLDAVASSMTAAIESLTGRAPVVVRFPRSSSPTSAADVQAAQESIRATGAATVLALSPEARTVTDALTAVSTVVGTSADARAASPDTAAPRAGQRIIPIGWSPIADLSPLTPVPSTPAQRTCTEAAFPRPAALESPGARSQAALTRSTGAVQRWLPLCDAARLIETTLTGLRGPENPQVTARQFRDAVWSLGPAWKPASSLGDRWRPGSLVGATAYRTMAWTAPCTTIPAASPATYLAGCFTYTGTEKPLSP